MMRITLSALTLFIGLCATLLGEAVTLNVVRFPEGQDIKVRMFSTRRAGEARLESKVKVETARTQIELRYENLKPAVLFGGDVTCYVVWAVDPNGVFLNLGEFWVNPDKDSATENFQTGLKEFAILLTAESFFQVERPSKLVISWNDRTTEPPVPSSQFFTDEFEDDLVSALESLGGMGYSGQKPLDLVQAERAFRMLQEMDGERHALDLFSRASLALERATSAYSRSKRGDIRRFSRESFTAANDALRIVKSKVEIERLGATLSQKEEEIAALTERASRAEARADTAEASLEQSSAERDAASIQIQTLTEEKSTMQSELNSLHLNQQQDRRRLMELEQSLQNLSNDRAILQSRLQNALSMVADTSQSARGLIVNLSDILFDSGRSRLRTEAQIALAKLAGILLIMQDLNLRIEGHTDSTGSATLNQKLSGERANAVFELLEREGIDASRMQTAGYGADRPIADNSTSAGRQKNRRVEVIIAEGQIAEEQR